MLASSTPAAAAPCCSRHTSGERAAKRSWLERRDPGARKLLACFASLAFCASSTVAQSLPAFTDIGSSFLSTAKYSNIRIIGRGSAGAAAVDAADNSRYTRIVAGDGSIAYTDTQGVFTRAKADVYFRSDVASMLKLFQGAALVAQISSDSVKTALASGGMLQSSDGQWTVYASKLDAKWYKATITFDFVVACVPQLTFVLSGDQDAASVQLGNMEFSHEAAASCKAQPAAADSEKKSNTGIIAAIVVVLGVLMCAGVGLGVFCCCRRRRQALYEDDRKQPEDGPQLDLAPKAARHVVLNVDQSPRVPSSHPPPAHTASGNGQDLSWEPPSHKGELPQRRSATGGATAPQASALNSGFMHAAVGISQVLNEVKQSLLAVKDQVMDDPEADSLDLHLGEKEEVAVKIMKIKPGTSKAVEALNELPFAEAAIAAICCHANIVRTLHLDVRPIYSHHEAEGAAAEGDHSIWTNIKDFQSTELTHSPSAPLVQEVQVRMVMENCRLGSLRDWVVSSTLKEVGPYQEAVPKSIKVAPCDKTLCALLTSLDVARGIKLLHKYKILHGDLKPHNVLLTEEPSDPRGFVAKLSDFGLSIKMKAHGDDVNGIKYGTVQYLAPETLRTHVMTKKADVYSFGLIMWELWHSKLHAEYYNVQKKKFGKAKGMELWRPIISRQCPANYVSLMTECWDSDVESRPEFVGGAPAKNIIRRLELMIVEHRRSISG